MRSLNPEKRLKWLTTHPHGETDDLYSPYNSSTSIKDWRSDIVLRYYNEAARRVCRKIGTEFIEVFEVANSLHDLSFDGAHYNGPIERQIARTVMHALCVP